MTVGERDTVRVNSPTPPPPAGGIDVDWDRLVELARKWYQPLFERDGWIAAGYLLLGAH